MIYNTSVERELERNEKLIGSKTVRDSLKSFSMDLKIQEGLTDHRVIFYLIRLRVISRMIPDVFLNPSIEDLKSVIMQLSANQKISPRTVEDYKQALRKYYKWKLSDKEFQKRVQWIRVRGNSVNRLKKSDDMITVDEIHKIIENSISTRDKALFSVLYDSGCRVGEILTLRIRDLQNDQWGTVLHVSGKTGERMVRIVGDSVPYLREWVQQHPKSNDPNSVVFVSVSAQAYGEPMNYAEMLRALSRAKNRAGITRRIHPHLFRHTRASILASRVAEAPLESQMGWIHGSKQTRTYVHLSAKDQDTAILKAYGIKREEDNIAKDASPKSCPRCEALNPSIAVYCRKCWLPLTIEATLELKEKEEHIEKELTTKGLIDDKIRALIENMPESERTGILTSIIQMALKEQKGSK
ncbi:MAG: site-specific integrase [Candidatus Thermoplasmatota archaeon]|jgi:integrase/ribosomal protein L40E|nr:site-specific integrase [Candidatus Thermoplasmatota archaeon]